VRRVRLAPHISEVEFAGGTSARSSAGIGASPGD
jgi:hypothetical protein